MTEVLLTWTLRLNSTSWGFLYLCTTSSQRNNQINIQSILSRFATIFARLLLLYSCRGRVFVLILYISVNGYGHVETPHSSLGKLDQAGNQYFVHILSLVHITGDDEFT